MATPKFQDTMSALWGAALSPRHGLQDYCGDFSKIDRILVFAGDTGDFVTPSIDSCKNLIATGGDGFKVQIPLSDIRGCVSKVSSGVQSTKKEELVCKTDECGTIQSDIWIEVRWSPLCEGGAESSKKFNQHIPLGCTLTCKQINDLFACEINKYFTTYEASEISVTVASDGKMSFIGADSTVDFHIYADPSFYCPARLVLPRIDFRLTGETLFGLGADRDAILASASGFATEFNVIMVNHVAYEVRHDLHMGFGMWGGADGASIPYNQILWIAFEDTVFDTMFDATATAINNNCCVMSQTPTMQVFPNCMSRTDDASASSIADAVADYPSNLVQFSYHDAATSKSYYHIYATTSAAVTPNGSDVIVQGMCSDCYGCGCVGCVASSVA